MEKIFPWHPLPVQCLSIQVFLIWWWLPHGLWEAGMRVCRSIVPTSCSPSSQSSALQLDMLAAPTRAARDFEVINFPTTKNPRGGFTLGFNTKETPKSSHPISQKQKLQPKENTRGLRSKGDQLSDPSSWEYSSFQKPVWDSVQSWVQKQGPLRDVLDPYRNLNPP